MHSTRSTFKATVQPHLLLIGSPPPRVLCANLVQVSAAPRTLGHPWGNPGTRNHCRWTFLAPGVSSDSFTWARRPGAKSSRPARAPALCLPSTQKEGWEAEAGPRCKGNRENVEEGSVPPEDLQSLEPRGLHRRRRRSRDDGRAREEPRGPGPGCGGAREKAGGPGRVPAGTRRVTQLSVQQPWRYSLYPPPPSPSSQEDVGSGRGRDRPSLEPVLGASRLSAHTAAAAASLPRLRPSPARRPALACLSRVAARSS